MEVDKDLIRKVLTGNGTCKEKYFAIYGEKVSRDKARHHINKLYQSLVMQDNITNSLDKIQNAVTSINDTLSNSSKLTINADGSQCSEKLVDCSEEQLKDPTFLLELHGYDPKKFELVSAGSSLWQNGSCNDTCTLYSSRIKVKPLSLQKNLTELIDNAVAKYIDKDADIDLEMFGDVSDKCEDMLEFCFPDLHVGLSVNEEGEYSLSAMQDNIAHHVANMCKIIKESGISNITLCFLGDIMHYDTAMKTTTKGTPQCSNVSFQKAFDSAVYILNAIIGSAVNLIDHGIIRIIYVPGNHDTILGYTLMSVMRALFETVVGPSQDKYVLFDIEQKSRKYMCFGKNLIGFTHGDMNKTINQWLYTEARAYVSDARQIEVHCGHLHSEQVKEENGVIVRHLPTICGVSPWEYEKGYSSIRRLACFQWNQCCGLSKIMYF